MSLPPVSFFSFQRWRRPEVGGTQMVMAMLPPSTLSRYHFKKFVGGVVLISRIHFVAVNGMCNIFYGWGRVRVRGKERGEE